MSIEDDIQILAQQVLVLAGQSVHMATAVNAESVTRAAVTDGLQSQADGLQSQADGLQSQIDAGLLVASQTSQQIMREILVLAGQVVHGAASLNQETINRIAGDEVLSQQVLSMGNTLGDDLSAGLAAEAAARDLAVSDLLSQIHALQQNIDNEAAARIAADDSLADAITSMGLSANLHSQELVDQEKQDRQTAIQQEAIARSAADASLSQDVVRLDTRIDAEAAARKATAAQTSDEVAALHQRVEAIEIYQAARSAIAPVPLTEFVRRVSVDIPKCPGPTIRDAVWDVTRDWCRRTWCVSKTFQITGETEGAWMVSLGGKLGGILVVSGIGHAHVAGDVMRFVKRNDFPPEQKSLFDHAASNTRGYRIDENGTDIHVYPMQKGETLTLNVILEPELTAGELPDCLKNEWLRPIVAGIKARLMEMAGKPWSNPSLSMHHMAVYEDGIQTAIGRRIRHMHIRKGRRMI